MKIENAPVNVIKWKEVTTLSLYRSATNDFLVMAISDGRAVAIRTNGVSSTRAGDCWTPGSESLWVPVEATLSLHGDKP